MRMMLTRQAVTVLAVVAVLGPGPCDARPTGVKDGVVLGTWGGENAALIADDTSAHVHIGCTYGNIPQAIEPDDAGYFDVPGQQNITAHPVDLGVMHPARFSGRVLHGTMTLTVTLSDTAVTLGPVNVSYGKEPRMGPCPICWPGMDRTTRSRVSAPFEGQL
jgi:hypothetical protein